MGVGVGVRVAKAVKVEAEVEVEVAVVKPCLLYVKCRVLVVCASTHVTRTHVTHTTFTPLIQCTASFVV